MTTARIEKGNITKGKIDQAKVDGPRAARKDAQALLAWYDRHRRDLPWRASPGHKPDPYHVLLSEVMLQQTTVSAVIPFFEAWIARWPTIGDLAKASLDDVMAAWAGLGYYARARRLHACAQAIVNEHGGEVPGDEAILAHLPGLGAYTAAAIAAIAFGAPTGPVDGNIERVLTRRFGLDQPVSALKAVLRRQVVAWTTEGRAGDVVQAMMDLGSSLCAPKKPACATCPFADTCLARAQGTVEVVPNKAAKPPRPERAARAYVAIDPMGAILVRRRPPKGLLGAMLEVPSTPWVVAEPPEGHEAAPFDGAWVLAPGKIRHVFTHFALTLEVMALHVARATPAPEGYQWLASADLETSALPSVMRKVIDAALASLR